MIADFLPHINGLTNHVYTLSQQLIQQKNDVFVITFPNKNNIKEINGIKIIQSKGQDIHYLRELSILLSGEKLLENLVKKENIDIIHAHSIYPQGKIATKIGKKYNIPTYITCHGPDFDKFYKLPFFKQQINQILDKSDNILAVSQNLADKIKKTNIKNIKEKTSLHLNSIDINKFKEINHPNNKNEPIVIFVGILYKRKNAKLLLDAKKQSKTNYKLIIVGDGPERNKLEKKVQKEKIDNVTFMGFRNDVENILPYADLFVLPSTQEAFGIVFIEALACGLPVIGCDDGGAKDIINDDVGLLIKPNNISSLANAIDRILSDEKLYCKFKSNARKKAMQFSQMKIPYQELKN